MAAAYAFGIVANHPFVDGNKRTALIVSIAFLKLNGLILTADKADRYAAFYGLAAGTVTEDQMTVWFQQNTARS